VVLCPKLRLSVDTGILRRLGRRNLLCTKGDDRIGGQPAELELLREELSELGFARDFKDRPMRCSCARFHSTANFRVRWVNKMASADAPLSSIVRWCLSFLDDRELLRLTS
jgi:hypothetical protein